MNAIITVIQVILGLGFTAGGLLKLTLPYAKYTQLLGQAWAQDFKPGQIRLIGVPELSGGIGLLIPLFVHPLRILAPLAAVGIALVMAGAMATHLRRSEYGNMVGNLLLFLAPALFVAYGTLAGLAA
jgi:uncharacterized membrane protein YphA (DoxX/SURF4 family)